MESLEHVSEAGWRALGTDIPLEPPEQALRQGSGCKQLIRKVPRDAQGEDILPCKRLHGQVGLTQAKASQEPLVFCTRSWALSYQPSQLPAGKVKQLSCSGAIESPGSGGEPHSPWAEPSISEQRMFQMGESNNTVCDYPLDPSAPGDLGYNSSIKHTTIHTPARNKDHK